MQEVIMIPVERYDRMVESYDKAIEELRQLREQIQALKCKNPIFTLSCDGFIISETMLKFSTSDEIAAVRDICKKIHEREVGGNAGKD